MNISIYNKASDTKSQQTIPFDIFLDNIGNGKWESIVSPIRALPTKAERDAAKKKAPGVTIAGRFTERVDNALVEHSGRLAMDFDELKDPETFKEVLSKDPYVEAAFVSIGGKGVCAIFKIDPKKHREAFAGLSEYLFYTYGQISDPTSVNISRLRFISCDRTMYRAAHKVDKFTQYPKSKPPKKVDKAIYAPDDFNFVMDQIISRRLNIVENYHEWLRIGFAFVWQFGEDGRGLFHQLSQYSSKYDSFQCDKQYTACLKHKGSNEATIAMFYYYAKKAGLEIYSERTKKIAYTAYNGKKAGLSNEQIAANLEKFEGITGAEDIIKQVIDNNIQLDEDTLIDQLELFIRQNYELRRNSITRYIENSGEIIKQKDLNSIYIKVKKIHEHIPYELVDRLINSEFVPDYNPLMDFFAAHIDDDKGTGHIDKLFSSIINDAPDYLAYFGKKWLVSAIAAAHGEHSPLMLALTGARQGTGKTQFFRRLLPPELKAYYAESKLDAGKDDEILMTQKWFIMDDEMGGKSKKESKRLKELTSKQWFSLREPYGRNNVDLQRLAVLCATTNDNEILWDPTGNRRIIPVIVHKVDFNVYNSVDKTALIMEAYHLWKEGFDWNVISEADIHYLRQDEGLFEASNSEAELIQKYYYMPEAKAPCLEMTATDIKVELENITKQKLILDRIGKELKRIGYQQKHLFVNGSTKRVYLVLRTEAHGQQNAGNLTKQDEDDLPF